MIILISNYIFFINNFWNFIAMKKKKKIRKGAENFLAQDVLKKKIKIKFWCLVTWGSGLGWEIFITFPYRQKNIKLEGHNYIWHLGFCFVYSYLKKCSLIFLLDKKIKKLNRKILFSLLNSFLLQLLL